MWGRYTFMFAKIGMHVRVCVMRAATEANKKSYIFVFHNPNDDGGEENLANVRMVLMA